MKVVVTGGAGFIGSNIVDELLRRAHNVTVVDNLSTGNLQNLRGNRRSIRFIQGDIRSSKTLAKAFRGADYVLHQAALPSVPRSINRPWESHDVNVNGLVKVLMAAHSAHVKKVVLASSSSVYGNRANFGAEVIKHKKEIMRPQPLSPYAVNKLTDEYYAKVFAHIYKLPTVCLRYFNVFGPRQDPKSEYAAVIPRFITAIAKNQRPTIFGDGLQSRDFTYVTNVVEANILAMTADKIHDGESINIACGQSITLRQLVKEINHQLHRRVKPKFLPPRPGDVKYSLADIRKAHRMIGYEPIVKFSEGLARTVDWYQA
ncbi:MAG: SDR family oxidoreductase [Candidatus Kerfeldbacteria bacterium]|nr:SDR family oxidoreductase [Candidatus Kerfeldbacteria bacterium]